MPANTTIDRLDAVKEKIANACASCDRPHGDVSLVAVSKTFGIEAIEPLLESGWRCFGENRVQESQSKWPILKQRYDSIELHLIGPLQSNKTADAVALFDVIQTVDREKIARALAAETRKQSKSPKLLIQVNTGDEPQKAGIHPSQALEFAERCKNEHKLNITGFMCIPPFDENPGPHFALLRQLGQQAGLSDLSMGMSQDYETAIEFGATMVRVGSAIFGQRS